MWKTGESACLWCIQHTSGLVGENLFEEIWRNKTSLSFTVILHLRLGCFCVVFLHFTAGRIGVDTRMLWKCLKRSMHWDVRLIIPHFRNTHCNCASVTVAPWKDLSTQSSYARNARLRWCSWSSRNWHRHACHPFVGDTRRSKQQVHPTFQLVRQSSGLYVASMVVQKPTSESIWQNDNFFAKVQQHATIWQWCSNTFHSSTKKSQQIPPDRGMPKLAGTRGRINRTRDPQLPVWGFQGGSPSIFCHPTPEAASLGVSDFWEGAHGAREMMIDSWSFKSWKC